MKTYSELLNDERRDSEDKEVEAQYEAEVEAAQLRLADKLIAAGMNPVSFDGMGGDWYDNSIELYKCVRWFRLGEALQKVIFDEGFGIAYVNHTDGWETHYNFGEVFEKQRGWRRRWVRDPTSNVTNALGEPITPANAGYYEISYWPEGWGDRDWRETGYMRIVPDPLEGKEA